MIPYQTVTSYSGRPDSITVGTCGSAALRFGVVTASTFRRLFFK
ncbi:Uncharacterised protein [Mycobacteroides abscessus subsp. abscessus]|nr:Uncharacterised protein [Mycobacteroides abscessus subsp. abscessus]